MAPPKVKKQAGGLLTSREVAQMFAVSRSTVVRWTQAGKLPYLLTLGGRYRYPRAEVERLRDGAWRLPERGKG